MGTARSPQDLTGELVSLLESFVSPISARAMVRTAIAKAERRCGGSPSSEAILEQIEASATVLISPSRREAALSSIRAIIRNSSEPEEQEDIEETIVPIREERDLNTTRMFAREACHLVGIRGYPAQKIVTAVSELARNIARYAGEGRIRLRIDIDKQRIVVVGEDEGPGIANLDEILAGEYRSRTGLGRGILGVKNLADHFDIQTGDGGTRVTVGFDY